jgi:hypothetical protein
MRNGKRRSDFVFLHWRKEAFYEHLNLFDRRAPRRGRDLTLGTIR